MTDLDTAAPIMKTEEGDHDRFTHIVIEGFEHKKTGEFVSIGNSVVEGMINQTPVRALCGKYWVPGADPGKYPRCPTCLDIAKKNGWKI